MQSPDTTIAYVLQHVATMMARHDDRVLQEQLGIGFSQFKILNVLKDNLHIQQRAIAHLLGQSEPSISRQIKLMIEQGLLTIRVRPENRREHLTTLTARGERFIDEAVNILARHHSPVFADISAKDQERLADMLQKIHERVCQINDPSVQHPL